MLLCMLHAVCIQLTFPRATTRAHRTCSATPAQLWAPSWQPAGWALQWHQSGTATSALKHNQCTHNLDDCRRRCLIRTGGCVPDTRLSSTTLTLFGVVSPGATLAAATSRPTCAPAAAACTAAAAAATGGAGCGRVTLPQFVHEGLDGEVEGGGQGGLHDAQVAVRHHLEPGGRGEKKGGRREGTAAAHPDRGRRGAAGLGGVGLRIKLRGFRVHMKVDGVCLC